MLKSCSAKAKSFKSWNQTNLCLLVTQMRHEHSTLSGKSTELHWACLNTFRFFCSSALLQVKKHSSYLGRWLDWCRALRWSGSWEPAAAGRTERSTLPTLLRWHPLLLYLHARNKLVTTQQPGLILAAAMLCLTEDVQRLMLANCNKTPCIVKSADVINTYVLAHKTQML